MTLFTDKLRLTGATQAIALAYDMIQVGRAERVVVIAGDSASSDTLMPWLGNGFRALGAATLSATPSEAARPFQAARSGMILGSGGIGMVLESEAAALQRFALTTAPTQPQLPDEGSTASFFSSAVGTAAATATSSPATPATPRTPFRCRLLGTQLSNSAFHGAAMDREHIAAELERFVSSMEAQCGVSRGELAQQGVYFSHETGTHASPSSSCAANEVQKVLFYYGRLRLLLYFLPYSTIRTELRTY